MGVKLHHALFWTWEWCCISAAKSLNIAAILKWYFFTLENFLPFSRLSDWKWWEWIASGSFLFFQYPIWMQKCSKLKMKMASKIGPENDKMSSKSFNKMGTRDVIKKGIATSTPFGKDIKLTILLDASSRLPPKLLRLCFFSPPFSFCLLSWRKPRQKRWLMARYFLTWMEQKGSPLFSDLNGNAWMSDSRF